MENIVHSPNQINNQSEIAKKNTDKEIISKEINKNDKEINKRIDTEPIKKSLNNLSKATIDIINTMNTQTTRTVTANNLIIFKILTLLLIIALSICISIFWYDYKKNTVIIINAKCDNMVLRYNDNNYGYTKDAIEQCHNIQQTKKNQKSSVEDLTFIAYILYLSTAMLTPVLSIILICLFKDKYDSVNDEDMFVVSCFISATVDVVLIIAHTILIIYASIISQNYILFPWLITLMIFDECLCIFNVVLSIII